MDRGHTRRTRARLALVACVLWLLGVELLPALHEGLHDRLAPHRHDHGSIVTVSFEDTTHRHPDGAMHYVAPKLRVAGIAARDDGARADSGPPDHAAGLAHHAAALAPAARPITTPLPIDRRPSWLAAAQAVDLVTRDPLSPSARGPPPAP